MAPEVLDSDLLSTNPSQNRVIRHIAHYNSLQTKTNNGKLTRHIVVGMTFNDLPLAGVIPTQFFDLHTCHYEVVRSLTRNILIWR